jgi:hypothetical protein
MAKFWKNKNHGLSEAKLWNVILEICFGYGLWNGPLINVVLVNG